MKIVHLCLGAFFIDNYSYQENILPKYHKELGHDVSIIASLQNFDKNGNPSYYDKASSYVNEYGISVTRLEYADGNQKIIRKLKKYKGLYNKLEIEKPDIIFIHNLQFWDLKYVIKYLKYNRGVKVYVDNHCDFSNSATNWLSKNILHKMVWRHYANRIEPFVTKFYGVLPARVNFLLDLYHLPKSKVELLVMGSDDEMVEYAKSEEYINEIKVKYGIQANEFLVVTGGKIDSAKRQTLMLMDAIKKIDNDRVKLLVFGSVTEELKEEFIARIDDKRIIYVGWIDVEKSYQYFAAADLVIFPGRHSVFWEQVAGMGIPMICKYWEGTTHIDIGGNVIFIDRDSSEEIKERIEFLLHNKEEYDYMKAKAKGKGMKMFSYREIAKRSIEGVEDEKN